MLAPVAAERAPQTSAAGVSAAAAITSGTRNTVEKPDKRV